MTFPPGEAPSAYNTDQNGWNVEEDKISVQQDSKVRVKHYLYKGFVPNLTESAKW